MRAPIPDGDDDRVAALRALGALDRPPSDDLDALTRLATFVSGSSGAAINLVDRHRQWPAASTDGLGEVPRDEAMCSHVIAESRPIVLDDASIDPRFVDNPFTTGERARVRQYASLPITSAGGQTLGTLCVYDADVRHLTTDQVRALQDLADQAMRLLELHHRSDQLSSVIAELDHLATHDALTGLANRRRFTDELDRRAGGQASDALVIFGDLDGFKAINDRWGHAAGDEVLQEVARRLTDVVRPDDLVARLGGDEFAVLCIGLSDASVPALIERLRTAVGHPMEIDGRSVRVGLSLGVADAIDGRGMHELLRAADDAMYVDKRSRAEGAPPYRIAAGR